MKPLLILGFVLILSTTVCAQSLQSKCGRLTGSALQMCIAQWQADQNRYLQQQQEFDQDLRQQQNQWRQDLQRMQQNNDRQLESFRRGCNSFGPKPPECR